VLSRLLTVAALVVAVVIIAFLLLGGDSGHKYNLIFQTGGQLVKGNEVWIGGAPAGTVDAIVLTEDNHAKVSISVDQELHEGTTAVIRTPSLSTVAGRYVSLSPGPNNAPALPDGGTLAGDSTTTPVDLDQLFDTFDGRTRKGLRDVIQGFAATYTGKGQQANETYKYFAPALSSTDRLLKELDADQNVFTDFIVNGAKTVTAISERRNDLTGLVSNANTALGAIADQNAALDRSLQLLPPTLRQANTSFVNLRAALDDLDPLINTTGRATKNLDEFLLKLQPVARRAVPVFTDLGLAVDRPGPSNDLAALVKNLVPLHKRGGPASRSGIRALNASQEFVTFARPYAPEFLASIGKLGAVSGYYDGDGNYARVQAAAFNLFRYNSVTTNLEPIPLAEKFSGVQFMSPTTRCPGGATQPVSGSNPFLDQGRLNGKCDPSDVPPGP
jgi:phospholipid/cholesterol/gamma-HCH transport system substrate-binding protein